MSTKMHVWTRPEVLTLKSFSPGKACVICKQVILAHCLVASFMVVQDASLGNNGLLHWYRCVGAKLAVAESIVTLVAVFKDFSVSLDPDHHPDKDAPIPKRMGVTLTPINGLWLRFHKLGSNSN